MAAMAKNAKFLTLSVNTRGAVIIEFALIAPIIILINILIYDLSTYYILSERSQHAAQAVHQLLTSDADHQIYEIDLLRADAYRTAVAGQLAVGSKAALVVIDAMPFYSNGGGWQFVVCWSWTSDSNVAVPPTPGSRLPSSRYIVNPWVPASAFTASAAILIVETHQTYSTVLGVPYLPARNIQDNIGPVRYGPSLPLNLLYSKYPGSAVLNDSTITDPNASNAVLCKR
jgi:Flp pilus assembly protein TadG